MKANAANAANAADAADAAKIVETLSALLPSVEEFCRRKSGREVKLADSNFINSTEVEVALDDIHSQGALLIHGAIDHLLALCRCLGEPCLTVAPYTCVRASMECSAIAAWITDPSQSLEQRIRRSFAFRFEGQRQQKKLLTDPAHALKIDASISNIESQALALGFKQLLDKTNTKIVGIGKMWPQITEIISAELGKGGDYRLLSAMAHGHPWAVQKMSFQESGYKNLIDHHLDPGSIFWLCTVSVESASLAIWRYFLFAGIGSTSISNLLDELYDRMQIKTLRPWN